MKKRSSKKKVFGTLLILIAFLTGTTTSMILIGINTTDSEPKIEIAVLYDDSSSTTIKSEELFTELIKNSNIVIHRFPISSYNDFYDQLQELPNTIQSLVLIGHGSNYSIKINEDNIIWEDLCSILLNLTIEKHVILSCYSSQILSVLSETEEKEKFITFESQIDYIVACYCAAMFLAEDLQQENILNAIYYKVTMDIGNIIDHAINCREPLWWGLNHNEMAYWAYNNEVPSNLINSLDFMTRFFMRDAGAADVVDEIIGATLETIINDPERRVLWLKHNYGTRLGLTICLGFIPVYTIPVYEGTAPQAAQTAYNNALEAYKNKNYTEAGMQLSYAVHYGQDMTMPHHVYDYLKCRITLSLRTPVLAIATALINLAISIYDILGDIMDLEIHDMVENWTNHTWVTNNAFRNQIFNKSVDFKFDIPDSGESKIYDAVENIAKWTRNQVTDKEIKEIFQGTDENAKADVIIPLLGKATAFTTAIYKSFIEEACIPANQPDMPIGPDLAYVGQSLSFNFKTIDPNGDNVSFCIDWGDGPFEKTEFVESGSPLQVYHTYSTNGTFAVRATARDDHSVYEWSDWSPEKSINIELSPPPPPIPSEPIIGAPDSVIINTNAQYSAVSTDPESYHLIYTFNFGDGYTWSSDLVQSGVRVYHSHTYTSVGDKTLTVTVQNTRGGENENSKTIEVLEPTNAAPNQPNNPSGRDEGWTGINYEFSFSTTDPEGDNIRYEIDWGDGTTTLTQYYSSGTSVTSYHQWDDEGYYFIKVRAQDEHGLWSSWSSEKLINIVLAPCPPTEPIIGGPDTVYININAQYSAVSTDPESYHLIYTFNFGDGYTWSSDLVQSGVRVYHSHTYTSVGDKTLTVTVQNTRGGENENSKTIEVLEPTNAAPNQPNNPSGRDEGWPDISYGFSFSTTDPNGDNIRYEIDWGDGTTTLTQYYSSGTSVTSYHQWSDNGYYYIKVRAQDEHGLWSSWSDSHIITIDTGPI